MPLDDEAKNDKVLTWGEKNVTALKLNPAWNGESLHLF